MGFSFDGIGQGLGQLQNQAQNQLTAATAQLAQAQDQLAQQQFQAQQLAQHQLDATNCILNQQIAVNAINSVNTIWYSKNDIQNDSVFILNDFEPYRTLWDVMNWKCTNCKKNLQFAKLGKMNQFRAPGMVILECDKCGFEFMTKAMTEEDRIDNTSRVGVDLAALRKSVKEFNLT